MAHKKGKKIAKFHQQEEEFKRLGLMIARRALENAIEWIDQKDTGWAITQADFAAEVIKCVNRV